MIKIDKNKPVPQTKIKQPTIPVNTRYPWKSMKVGDSFLFPEGIVNPYSYIKYHPGFVVQLTSEGYRCWRIK